MSATYTNPVFDDNFPDPAKATGTEEEIMAQFRSLREQIKAYAQDFVRSANL